MNTDQSATENDDTLNEIMDELEEMFDHYDPLSVLSVLAVFITRVISECASNEMAARKTLEIIAATILLNGTTAITHQYSEEESLPQ